MTIMAPKNKWELSDMVKFALNLNSPVAIRYPKGDAYDGLEDFREPIKLGKSEEIHEGDEVLLYAFGSMVKTAERVREILLERGINATLTNARFAAPLDRHYLLDAKKYKLIVTMEENVLSGGFGEHVTEFMYQSNYEGNLINVALPNEFIPHGSRDELLKVLGMDAVSVSDRIVRKYKQITHKEI
jgi:1-deoxy-D-xylulose-5-phosphate synthase